MCIRDRYIVVEKGFFFPTDYYIPMSSIATASDDEVYLTVSKDDALNQGWDLEPSDDNVAAQDNGVERQNVAADDSTLRVPVHEELLDATKRTEKMGDVTISKHTVTEQVTIDVPVKEERVRVEWKESAGGTGGAHEGAFKEGSFEVPVSREVVDVSKRTVHTGELEVTKETDEHTEHVSDSVRREVVDVDDSRVNQGSGKSKPR